MPKITYLDEEEESTTHHKQKKEAKKTFIATLIIVSLLMGFVGGTGSLIVLSSSKTLKEKLGINLQDLNLNQTNQKLVLEESSKVIDSAKKVTPAVVSITSSKNVLDFFGQVSQQQGGGTGFIITNDGLILTNKHVAQSGDSLNVLTSDGKTYDAKVVALDPTNDLAILKIEAAGLPVVELGDSDSLQIGQWVIAVGNALGELQNTVTVGVISARERQLTAGDNTGGSQEQLNNLLQTDAAINPGNSGGPLVNLAGQVIGIDTAIAGNAQGIGFAIPINQAKSAIESYKKNGKIIKAQLGVRYVMVNPQVQRDLNLAVNYGALIIAPTGQDAVAKGTPADIAGLKSNDVILSINDQMINDAHPLASIINQLSPGDQVTIKYQRGQEVSTVQVKLGSVGN